MNYDKLVLHKKKEKIKKNFTKNLIQTTSACWFIFFDRQITTLTTALHSFRVWYAQCLAKRLTMNLIEFIHLKVWRSKFIEELDNNGIDRPRVCKIQRLSFQNCLAVSLIFGRETSFPLNWMNPIANLTIIQFLCREKLIKLIRNRLFTVI